VLFVRYLLPPFCGRNRNATSSLSGVYGNHSDNNLVHCLLRKRRCGLPMSTPPLRSTSLSLSLQQSTEEESSVAHHRAARFRQTEAARVGEVISVAVQRPEVRVRRCIVAIAATKYGRVLLDTKLQRRTVRTERPRSLTGVLIVRGGNLFVWITEVVIAAITR